MKNLSIKMIVSIALVLIIVADISIFSFLIFRDTKRLLTGQIQKYYDSAVDHVREKIVGKFLLIENAAVGISENTLLINALVDELGRERYLPQFMKKLSLTGVKSKVFIGLYDFEFGVVETNSGSLDSVTFQSDEKQKILSSVIEKGEIYQNFKKVEGEFYYLIAVPVYYEKYSEGVLLVYLQWENVWRELFQNWEGVAMSLYYKNDLISTVGSMEEEGEARQIEIETFPGLVLRSKIPFSKINDPVFQLQQRILLWGAIYLCVSLFISVFLVARRISRPIIQLNKAAQKVADGVWDKVQIRQASREIMDLSHTFNTMTEKLEQTQNHLQQSYLELQEERNKQVQNAYTAGIAENAVSILHNIGNAITPTLVNNHHLVDQQKKLNSMIRYLKEFYKVFQKKQEERILDAYLSNDPKGRQMLPFIRQLADQMEKNVLQSSKWLEMAERQLQHISNIITLQQKYANHETFRETFLIRDVIKDVIQILGESLKKREIQLVQDIAPDVSAMHNDKNKLVQVLLNLLKNSIESIDEQLVITPEMSPRIVIRVSSSEKNMLSVSIEDNGRGTEPETIEKAFEFGYSSKNRGSGFGLHDCANFICANQGDISLSSPGIGQGATVHILLPYCIGEAGRQNLPKAG